MSLLSVSKILSLKVIEVVYKRTAQEFSFWSPKINSANFRSLFLRNNAENIAKRHLDLLEFSSRISSKVREDKNEIRAIRSHYFSTVLYERFLF